MPILDIQRQLMELGRIRLGHKGDKGQPVKLDKFRLTSASRMLLEAAARLYGGEVQEWKDAPDAGYFELFTDSSELPVKLQPVYRDVDGEPTYAYSQWYELYSAGGVQRRCDGVTELLTGQPCLCIPEARECKMTTRVSVILPELPGVGVWRLESHGYYAAVLLPGTLDLLQNAATEGVYIDAVLRIEQRTKKVPGEGTRRFIVPVLDVPGVTVGQLMAGEVTALAGVSDAVNPPQPRPPRPELPAGPEPTSEAFKDEQAPEWPEPPALPTTEQTEIETLTRDLLDMAEELGALDATIDAVLVNHEKHADDPAAHLTYLRSQITRARNTLEARA